MTGRRYAKKLTWRSATNSVFTVLTFVATSFAVVLLAVLLWKIAVDGLPRLSWDFLKSVPSRFPDKSGIYSPLMGSLWVIVLTGLVSIPIGIAAGIYLEEMTNQKNRVAAFIQINISNLAGVPSIVYGMLGLALFVRWMELGRSVLAGALTLSLLILPMLITVTQEALRAVPGSLREASYALGATQLQTIRRQVLPNAASGIFTGIILSLSRAMGETAPLIMVGAVAYVRFAPKHPLDSFTVLPMQIFSWSEKPQRGFHEAAASAIIVLMVLLLVMNSVAIVLRSRNRKAFK